MITRMIQAISDSLNVTAAKTNFSLPQVVDAVLRMASNQIAGVQLGNTDRMLINHASTLLSQLSPTGKQAFIAAIVGTTNHMLIEQIKKAG